MKPLPTCCDDVVLRDAGISASLLASSSWLLACSCPVHTRLPLSPRSRVYELMNVETPRFITYHINRQQPSISGRLSRSLHPHLLSCSDASGPDGLLLRPCDRCMKNIQSGFRRHSFHGNPFLSNKHQKHISFP